MILAGSPIAEAPLLDTTVGDYSVASLFNDLLRNPGLAKEFIVEVNSKNRSTAANKTYTYSTGGRGSESGDPIANTPYPRKIKNALTYSEKLSFRNYFSGKANIGTGVVDIAIDRYDDDIADVVFEGQPATVKMGQHNQAYSTFGDIRIGTVDKVIWTDSKLQFIIKSHASLLRNNIQQELFGGTGGFDGNAELADKPKPFVYGECKNITPVLVDPINLYYVVGSSGGGINSVDKVYFAGVEATHGTDWQRHEANNGFECLVDPAGVVTCDVKGEETTVGDFYYTKINSLIYAMLREKAGWAAAYIDITSLNALATLFTYDVGFYYPGISHQTIESYLGDILRGCGAFFTWSRADQLAFGQVLGVSGSSGDIKKNDVISISRTEIPVPTWRTRVGHTRNWTIQGEDQLAGAVTATRIQELSQPYKVVSKEDATVQNIYVEALDRLIESYLVNSTDAQSFCDDMQALYGSILDVYNIRIKTIAHDFVLGDVFTIYYDRFGLDSGVDMKLIGYKEDQATDTAMLNLLKVA